jgi:hypothetical protein
MMAWGFTYKSHLVWVKDKRGLGYWGRNRHELLLIGIRGRVPCPAPGAQSASVIEAPRGRHSEKPDIFAEHIERWFPNVPKLEMFARNARPGWSYHGNEVALGPWHEPDEPVINYGPKYEPVYESAEPAYEPDEHVLEREEQKYAFDRIHELESELVRWRRAGFRIPAATK